MLHLHDRDAETSSGTIPIKESREIWKTYLPRGAHMEVTAIAIEV
jgi:hypothetical protein